MATTDLIFRWSTMSLEEIEQELKSHPDDPVLTQFLGQETVEEAQELANRPAARGVGGPAVVLLPGIMGSLLTSIRGVTTLLWINPIALLKGQAAYLQLNQDGSDDASPDVEVMPLALEKSVYLKIGLSLRRHFRLLEFPYDWRRPVEYNADVLHRSIERWAKGDPQQKFILVGHSMGGIVSRAYLARHPADAERRIQRVIMHGTPHYGAAGAVEGLVNGNRMMDIANLLNDGNDMRQLILNLPSVYELLPAPPELFPKARPFPANWDLYQADEWQVQGIRQDYLNLAKNFHKMMAASDPQVEMIEIAGANQKTTVEIEREAGPFDKVSFKPVNVEVGSDSGDGTVPLWSALLPSAKIYYVEDVHRYLPARGYIIDATIDLIASGRCRLPDTFPRRRAAPAPAPELPPVTDEAERLRGAIQGGEVKAEDLAQFYFSI